MKIIESNKIITVVLATNDRRRVHVVRMEFCATCGKEYQPLPRQKHCSKCAKERHKEAKLDWWNRVGKFERARRKTEK